MFEDLIGRPLDEVQHYLSDKGIDYTVESDTSNAQADVQIVVRITHAYHLVSMGFKLNPTENYGTQSQS